MDMMINCHWVQRLDRNKSPDKTQFSLRKSLRNVFLSQNTTGITCSNAPWGLSTLVSEHMVCLALLVPVHASLLPSSCSQPGNSCKSTEKMNNKKCNLNLCLRYGRLCRLWDYCAILFYSAFRLQLEVALGRSNFHAKMQMEHEYYSSDGILLTGRLAMDFTFWQRNSA